jgi:hypothetical protein
MRGQIRAAHALQFFLEKTRPRNAKTRHEGRALLSAEAEEFVCLTATKFPEIEPPVKRKQRFR